MISIRSPRSSNFTDDLSVHRLHKLYRMLGNSSFFQESLRIQMQTAMFCQCLSFRPRRTTALPLLTHRDARIDCHVWSRDSSMKNTTLDTGTGRERQAIHSATLNRRFDDFPDRVGQRSTRLSEPRRFSDPSSSRFQAGRWSSDSGRRFGAQLEITAFAPKSCGWIATECNSADRRNHRCF